MNGALPFIAIPALIFTVMAHNWIFFQSFALAVLLLSNAVLCGSIYNYGVFIDSKEFTSYRNKLYGYFFNVFIYTVLCILQSLLYFKYPIMETYMNEDEE